MNLLADQVFFDAIKENAELMQTIGNRLYSTAIPLPDAEADNVPIPYVILTFDGLTNDGYSKDGYEGIQDNVTVGVIITAATREELGTIANDIRTSVREYFNANFGTLDGILDDYRFSAQPVQYYAAKPCFWQELSYQCAFQND